MMLGRRRTLAGIAAVLLGTAGCAEDNPKAQEKTAEPTPTQQETETHTTTEQTEEPDPDLHFEEIYQETFNQDREPISPNQAESILKRDTLEDQLIRVSDRLMEYYFGEAFTSEAGAEAIIRETIHNSLGYSIDEVKVLERKSNQGNSKYRVIDNTGEKEKQHIFELGHGETAVLADGEKPDNNDSQERILGDFREGKSNPLSILDRRERIKEMNTPPFEKEGYKGADNRNNEFLVEPGDVDITFRYEIGEHVYDMARNLDIVKPATEYAHNIAAETTGNMVLDITDKMDDLDPVYSNVEEIGELETGTVVAATVDDKTYEDIAFGLYEPKSWKEEGD